MKNQFGGKATKEHLEIYSKSKNWDGSKFVNLEETSMDIGFSNMPKLLYEQFCKRENRSPKQKIPIIPFDKNEFLAPSQSAKFIWYGHSAVLMRMNNKTILMDPMLGQNASPIAPFSTTRFSENSLEQIDDFPEIDIMMMSHDHYDHLDLDSIKRLIPKVKNYCVALGVGRHLEKWGVEASKIVELDWWDSHSFDDITITSTPSRHFSGRGLKDRAKSLWCGWTFKTDNENIYNSGDGGYGEHFKEIGERLGPFDFAIMENGQYHELWHQIHMYPEESIQAAIESNSKYIMPVHWAGFALALHTWTEPIERFKKEGETKNMKMTFPKIGELFSLDDPEKTEDWWSKY